MDSIYVEPLKALPTERYIELKQKAYDICFELGGPMDFKKVSSFVAKELNFRLDSVEGVLMTTTLIYPYDAKVCGDYVAAERDVQKLIKFYSPMMQKIITDKSLEIDYQKLDLLLGQGILNCPIFDDRIAGNMRK